MRVLFLVLAIVFFVVSVVFANMPHTGYVGLPTDAQFGGASCGFAIACGLALVAAALVHRDELRSWPPKEK